MYMSDPHTNFNPQYSRLAHHVTPLIELLLEYITQPRVRLPLRGHVTRGRANTRIDHY